MTMRNTKTYLICYDIADPRRLGRLHRYLSKHAIPVQYSVFQARLTANQKTTLCEDIANLIDPRYDDVRIYHLPDKLEIVQFGINFFPEGVGLHGDENAHFLTSSDD